MLQTGKALAVGVGKLEQLAPLLRQLFDEPLADRGQIAGAPVVPVDHVVGAQLLQNIVKFLTIRGRRHQAVKPVRHLIKGKPFPQEHPGADV